MPEITFLRAAKRPLAKVFTKEETRSYPRVKNVTSITHPINDIVQFEGILREHAVAGDCLLKGPLTAPLKNESRRGRVDRNAHTGLLVLDFDSIEMPFDIPVCNADYLKGCAEFLIGKLPSPYHDVSYVVQASASFGMKGKKIGLHLFFFLYPEVSARALRDYMTLLNFDGDYFEEQIGLSATGTALSFVVDRTVADNSRLIYIAPPQFEAPITDPWASSHERIVLVEKQYGTIDLRESLQNLSPESAVMKTRKKVKELRALAGLRGRMPKTTTVTVDDMAVSVVTNPDRILMTFAQDEGDYVRYNVGGGDSAAYWVHKFNPEVVYNFKGEPNFLFEKADPEAYQDHLSRWNFSTSITEEGFRPLIFLDYATAKYYYGLYDPANERMESIYRCSYEHLRHFVAEYGGVMPETIPVWQFEFQPNNPKVIDFEQRFLNRYCPPDIVRYPVAIPPELTKVEIGYAGEAVQKYCPTIYKLLFHVCGNGVAEFEHFINWLAYVVQRKEKAMTAWIFHGVPGTGKGLLFANVLAPLLGPDNALMKRQDDLEEKFNEWLRNCLLFVVDEFRLDASQRSRQSGMLNKIKNLITEKQGTVRAMNVDQQDTKFYANVIFFSNDRDAVRIQEGDRRFNVAPRQEVPIIRMYPELLEGNRMQEQCAMELPAFASFLLQFKVDLKSVILPIENAAKEEMREASSDSIDLFVRAVIEGDLEYFLPVLDEKPRIYGEDHSFAARNIVKAIVRDFEEGKEERIFMSELRPLYNVLCGRAENEHKFGKLLSRHGLQPERLRRGKMNRRGIRVTWKLKDNTIKDLREEFLDEADYKVKEDTAEAERVSTLH